MNLKTNNAKILVFPALIFFAFVFIPCNVKAIDCQNSNWQSIFESNLLQNYKDYLSKNTKNCSSYTPENYCNSYTCTASCTSGTNFGSIDKATAIKYLKDNYCSSVSSNPNSSSSRDDALTGLESSFLDYYNKNKSTDSDCTSLKNKFCQEKSCIYNPNSSAINAGSDTDLSSDIYAYCTQIQSNETKQANFATFALSQLKQDSTKDCDQIVQGYCAMYGCTDDNITNQYLLTCDATRASFCVSNDCSGIGSASGTMISINKLGTISCSSIKEIVNFFDGVYVFIEVIGALLLIVMTLLNFMKVVASDKADDEMKKAKKNFVTRIIIMGIIFLLPIIVKLLINAVGGSTCYIG